MRVTQADKRQVATQIQVKEEAEAPHGDEYLEIRIATAKSVLDNFVEYTDEDGNIVMEGIVRKRRRGKQADDVEPCFDYF